MFKHLFHPWYNVIWSCLYGLGPNCVINRLGYCALLLTEIILLLLMEIILPFEKTVLLVDDPAGEEDGGGMYRKIPWNILADILF